MAKPEMNQNIDYFRSPLSYQPIDDCGSLWHAVFGQQNNLPLDKVAYKLFETGESMTFGRLKDHSLTLAHGLINKLGLSSNDAVLVFALNTTWFPAFFWACQAAQITITFANPLYTVRELLHQAGDSAVKAMVTDSEYYPIVSEVADLMKLPRDRVFFMRPDDTHPSKTKSVWTLASGAKHTPKIMSREEAHNHIAYRCYSSGTTGISKGVNTTHYNVINVIRQSIITAPDWYPKWNIGLCARPLYHAGGLFLHLLVGSYQGSTTIIMRTYKFEPYWKLVEDEKVTWLDLLPPQALAAQKSPILDKYSQKTVKWMMCGSAPFSAETQRQLENRIGAKLCGGYGMTESTSVITHCSIAQAKLGRNGFLLAGMEGRVVNGELWVKGPNIFKSYHNRPDATKETFQDGWMKTGDIVHVDEEGQIAILDRLKELIKYKGYQVPPAELEGVLTSREDVQEAAVVPVDDPDHRSEVPRGFILLNDQSQASEKKAKEIIEWTNTQLAEFKRFRGGLVFVDAIPKNPTGKLMRRTLRERTNDTVYGRDLFPVKQRPSKL